MFSIHLFCSSSLASNSKSSGLSCVGEDGDNAGVDRVVEEDVVCKEADGLATWLAIWLTVWDTVFFTHERVELSFPATLSVATCDDKKRLQWLFINLFSQPAFSEQRKKDTIYMN